MSTSTVQVRDRLLVLYAVGIGNAGLRPAPLSKVQYFYLIRRILTVPVQVFLFLKLFWYRQWCHIK